MNWTLLGDCLDGDAFLDLPPDAAEMQMKIAGIDPEYYLAIPIDPSEEILTKARRHLAILLGLLVSNEDGFFSTLMDLYHDLQVGPITSDVELQWSEHPWVTVIRSTTPGWDCNYDAWCEKVAKSIPNEAFVPNAHSLDGDACLPDGVFVEQIEDAWVIKDVEGSYWCDLLENGWTDEPNDDDASAIRFPSRIAAVVSYCEAERMYRERVERRLSVMRTLHGELGDS